MTASPSFCAHCGAALVIGDPFCGSCGTRVSEESALPSDVAQRLMPSAGQGGWLTKRWTVFGAGFFVAATVVAAVLILLPRDGDTGNPGHFEGLLRAIPDTPETRQSIVMSDIERLRTDLQVLPPSDPGDGEQVEGYLRGLFGASEQTPPPLGWPEFWPRFWAAFYGIGLEYSSRVLHDFASFGMGIDLVDQTAEACSPPEVYYVARGRFDDISIAHLLEECRGCPSPPEIEDHRGITFFSWGNDYEIDLGNRLVAPFDQLGRGGRIAAVDSMVFRSNWTAGMRRMIDVSQGQRSSLADNEDFRLAAAALDTLGTYNAFISDDTQRRTDDLSAIAETLLATGILNEAKIAWDPPSGAPVLPRYAVVGLGEGFDQDGQYLGVVLIHDSNDAAQQSASLLERRVEETSSLWTGEHWSDLIDGVETEVHGRVLVAKLRTSRLSIGFHYQRDPLLLHD